MSRNTSLLWGAAVMGVALLNIAEILPDWTTITAILTMPAMVALRIRKGRCA
ncbi:hypothetical protein [Novosphingobium mangrovi (ex Hu et al. 2023)]|uniref:Uncharacterized protein n=1 Tax=Novosphingobium mangrovi (ex Hu et al. 2023) TaxID=2930094 RepID=A0ABT0AET6_9SPHN|nr:hypothetical protein [Novosphingobium mangrovi (ex Hu et al. 2023)]MCJ1961713.1 hypothetical protein [Novosphingobium mangrovi (ex Hu et al. 2023)]